jgi:hypothetical protein
MPNGIPDWNAQGVLPHAGYDEPISAIRSPYIVLLDEVVLRFGSTQERLSLLDGFLQYRAELHAVGLVRGFQWIDGSFLEDVESLASRPPNDLDVVTFYRLPEGVKQADLAQLAPGLFDNLLVSQRLRVDAQVQCLDVPSERIVAQAVYWYSMWSDRRDGTWKGFVQIDLSPYEDEMARASLRSRRAAGAQS